MDNIAKTINRETLAKRRLNNYSITSSLHFDSIKTGQFSDDVVINSQGKPMASKVVMDSLSWENSQGYSDLWSRIEDVRRNIKRQIDRRANITVLPDDYYDLVDYLRLDITRRRMEEVDYCGLMTQEIINPNFSRTVRMDEFLPYAGDFQAIEGNNNTVPMIEAKTGATGTATQILYSLGFARTLLSELYDSDIYSLEKVQAAVVRAHTAKRNYLSVGQLVAKTTAAGWAANQQQAADTTSDATKDELMYNTVNSAISKILGLKDPQTNQEIFANRLAIVCRPSDVRRINRAINGQLNIGGKGKPGNFAALNEITEIWPYRGDVLYVGPDTKTYAGVAENKAYLIVPGPVGAPAYTLTKRAVTSEVGRGSVLELSREERAWYFSQVEHLDEFFGESASLTSGTGYCVEITLPSE